MGSKERIEDNKGCFFFSLSGVNVIEWHTNDTRLSWSLSCSPLDTNSRLTLAGYDWQLRIIYTVAIHTPTGYIYSLLKRGWKLAAVYLSPFFSLSFSRSCRTRRRLIVANGPSSWRHERGNGIKPRRAARDLLIVTTSCRGAARRRASGRDSNSSQDSYIMYVHRVDSLFFRLLSFRFPYLFIGYRSPLMNLSLELFRQPEVSPHARRARNVLPWSQTSNFDRGV